MNVFAPDPDPVVSARVLADRHVVKMTLETAQVLCTAADWLELDTAGLYRPTHRKHPVVLGCVEDPGYCAWTIAHGRALAAEYTRRYDKVHKSQAMLERVERVLLARDMSAPPQRFPLAMPDEYKHADPHASYRVYLHHKYAAWGADARWTRAERPPWAW